MLIPKDEWERSVFPDFAAAAVIQVDPTSISSVVPPEPDIRFTVRGVERWAVLVEITDEDLAARHLSSLKTGVVTGGAYSQRKPLERSIRAKATRAYRTNGSRLDLLAYYDKQAPAVCVDPDLFPQAIGAEVATMLESGIWTQVWVYRR
jgi:hypothetical protein